MYCVLFQQLQKILIIIIIIETLSSSVRAGQVLSRQNSGEDVSDKQL